MKHYVKFRRMYKYQLDEDYEFKTRVKGYEAVIPAGDGRAPWVELKEDGTIRFRCGYSYDGPSGPTFDTPDSMGPALLHDGLYQLLQLGLLPKKVRKLADRIFVQMLKDNEMGFVRRTIWYVAVRIWPANWGLGS